MSEILNYEIMILYVDQVDSKINQEGNGLGITKNNTNNKNDLLFLPKTWTLYIISKTKIFA